MSKTSLAYVNRANCPRVNPSPAARPAPARLGAFALILLLGAGGCRTASPPDYDALKNAAVEGQVLPSESGPATGPEREAGKDHPAASEAILLQEGDAVRVSFPGAPNLNSMQTIRRDGRIALPLIGEFKAAGLSPVNMEKELLKLYAPQLQVKQLTVAVESSAYPVYITGAVLRPGKIMSNRPLTILEAIMEAGGYDPAKANLKAVRVLRRENERTEYHTFNLKRVLDGRQSESFNLKPSDIIFVPERFTWF